MKKILLCSNCIAAIKSRGEKVFIGNLLPDYDDEENPTKCEWCEEDGYETYECMFND